LWAGVILALLGFFSYFVFFVQFPVTRNFPWANLLLFSLAAAFLVAGTGRAFRRAEVYRGKVLGPILSAVSLLIFGAFIFVTFIVSRQLPASANAPRVGTKAPEFGLPDTSKKAVTLAELLTTPVNGVPPKGVLLVFYRGYW